MNEQFPSHEVSEHLAHLPAEQAAQVQEKVARYGGVEFFEERFGLGMEDIAAVKKFGNYEGPLLDALVPDDPQDLGNQKCPLGDTIAEAYKDGGLSAVQEKFNLFKAIDPRFEVTVSESSFAREALVKKKNLSWR